jgi:Flp pilus assembly protein TadG
VFNLDNKGSVAVTVALALPLIIGGAAFGVEAGYWRYDQVRLQQAADAAAFAAGLVAREGGTGLTAAATTAATADGYSSTTDSLTINTPSTATPSDANSVEAIISRTETHIFAYYLTHATTVVSARATVSYVNASNACVVALSTSAAPAVSFSGNASMSLSGCSIMSDSIASNGFSMGGSSNVTAPCVYAVGGASLGGTLSLTTCSAVKTAQPPVGDPYSGLAMPSHSGSCTTTIFNNAAATPGHYCSLTLKGTVPSMASGVYVIDGGSLSINANSTVTGSGVTFYLVNGATVSMAGNSHVTLTAPTSGTYSGLLFIGDPASTGGITINGDNTSSMTGVIYAPDAAVTYTGNFSGASGCTQIVANTVSFTGSVSFADNCTGAGRAPVRVGSAVKLTS